MRVEVVARLCITYELHAATKTSGIKYLVYVMKPMDSI